MAERPAWYCRFKTATSWLAPGSVRSFQRRVGTALRSTTVFKPGARVGDDVVLAGQWGIYHLGSEGKLTLIQARSGTGHARAHLIHGTIVVFDDQTGATVWSGGSLRPASSEFAWAKDCDVSAVTEEVDGYIAITNKRDF